METLRRVTYLKIYDINHITDPWTLIKEESAFGYSIHHRYFYKEKAIYDGNTINFTEQASARWLAFHVREDHLEYLKRKVQQLRTKSDWKIRRENENEIVLWSRRGDSIWYQGNKKEEFVQKVLTNKF